MKEILYFQAGTLANHIGTHFWNTQEAYFTYADGDDPLIFHDRSFREGLTPKVILAYRGSTPSFLTAASNRASKHTAPASCSSTGNVRRLVPRKAVYTLSPRIAKFGTLSDGLYGGSESDSGTPQWYAGNRLRQLCKSPETEENFREGSVAEHRQDSISKSDYHARLDENELEPEEDDENACLVTSAHEMRYWSDYSRVYFHPRSLQRLPDPADWEAQEGDWIKSRETFLNHETVCIDAFDFV